MRRALENRLTFRFALGLCLTTGAILVAAGLANLRLQRVHLTRQVMTAAAERVDDIRRSTREAMMRNSPGEVSRIINTIADQPTIRRIRLVDKQGRIRASSEGSELGSAIEIYADQCVSCHRQSGTLERIEMRDRVRIFRGGSGGRLMGVIAPIRNEPACANAACHAHPAGQSILGVLDVQLSLAGVDASLAVSERQMLLGLLLTILAVLTVAWLLTWRMIIRPVGKLTEAASRVADGDLTTFIPVTSKDEIGEMTEAWNAMIAKLGRAQVVLERWGRTLEQKIKEKTEELDEAHRRMLVIEKMASLGKLAAIVAHEINNPLTGIGTYAHLLRRRELAARGDSTALEETSAERERILKLIEDEAARCGRIVSDLLLFSRAPGSDFAEHDLRAILERSVMLLHPAAAKGTVALRLEVREDLPTIDCDAAQLQQLILALAMNALEATPPGGTVTLSARPNEGESTVELEVTDTGRGIPAEHLDKIFEPFFTTKTEGSGVGLGLAVAFGIVSRHRGDIDVTSTEGQGTSVLVRLPRRQPAERPSEDSMAESSTP